MKMRRENEEKQKRLFVQMNGNPSPSVQRKAAAVDSEAKKTRALSD